MIDIHKSLGGWPVIEGDNWDESQWSWTKSVKDFRAKGYSADYLRKPLDSLLFLFIFLNRNFSLISVDFSVGTDLKNSTRRIIDVSFSDQEGYCKIN